jgi:hypothetical protein
VSQRAYNKDIENKQIKKGVGNNEKANGILQRELNRLN